MLIIIRKCFNEFLNLLFKLIIVCNYKNEDSLRLRIR